MATSWIRRYGRNPVSFQVQYHADQDLTQLTRFWAEQVDVAAGDIRPSRKSNSNQLAGRTWRSAHGVLTVQCNDMLLRARLEAWMDCVRESWA